MSSNGNPLKGVPLALGGRTYEIRFDYGTICAIEEQTGRNVLRDGLEDIDARTLRAILYENLRRQDKGMSLERVGELVFETGVVSLLPVVLEAIERAMPAAKAEDAAATPDPPSTPAGSSLPPSPVPAA